MFEDQILPVGTEDFKKLIDNNRTYVDKTLLVKEFWQDPGDVVLVTRPRRFGKTLNLSMLKYFFEKTDQDVSYLFEKTKIWAYPEYRALQGQFLVISLTFKDIQCDTWESAYAALIHFLIKNIEQLLSPIFTVLTPSEQKWYARLLDENGTDADYTNSLLYATIILERYYQKKVIVLIDEYDAPIIHAYLHDYYPQMIQFMRILLSKVLKSNTALAKGFLTGITRTSKEGIFSGLNNVAIRTVLNTQYADKFGFTQEEVDQLLIQYNLIEKRDDIKNWYDGYVFGDINVYNPWSVVSCINERGELRAYWANTSNNDLIRDLIASSSRDIKDDIELLLQGKVLVDKEVDESVSLRDIKNSMQGFWGLFLAAGYLTVVSRTFKDSEYFYTLALPNQEITLLYNKLIANAIDRTLVSGKIAQLFTALIKGDLYQLTILLKEFVLHSCSVHDLPKDDPERSIHMFVLGLLAGLFSRYIIRSNRESGHGRYDIMLTPRTPQDPGIVIEFKKSTSKDEAVLTALAQEALEQIKSRAYVTDIRSSGYAGSILCYGIAIFGKHVVVNLEVVQGDK